MYGEETDLCHRARARGARPRMTPEATIVHYVGASSKRRSDKDGAGAEGQGHAGAALPAAPGSGRSALFLLRMWPLSRKLGGALAARLTGRAGARARRRALGRGLGRRGATGRTASRARPAGPAEMRR